MTESTIQCTGCGEELPATPEFFWRRKYTANGLWGRCKACCSETPCMVRRKLQREAAKRAPRGTLATGVALPLKDRNDRHDS